MTVAEELTLAPGLRIRHAEFGDGVIVGEPRGGMVRVFFASGERQVPVGALSRLESRLDRITSGVDGTAERAMLVARALEAHALPLLESAPALTAAPIDLLPHQVVLTHRIATATPRRFLVADEVGLGKTIETALVLRELASRGELTRAIMIVPAGLVSNWHRELNEVFGLGFEVFGSEGDVTDRKTNAFAKHDRLIASIDTLKRPQRVKRLLEAPRWDLVVFDEAHHLTATRSGRKVTKTENYRLAEALRGHTRDLLLLSATPHQGDHFRFWMLVQLLNPTLFRDADEMVDRRHRLNNVVFRRTKADACRPDGTPLFTRRMVSTEALSMGEAERRFYDSLREYLQDGFAVAERQGSQGRALGFVMTVFQKIAASSFAAVRRTLRRRLLTLTLHESILRDQQLDVDGRHRLLEEARELVHEDYGIDRTAIGRGRVDAILADLRVKLLRKLDPEGLDGDVLAAGEAQAENTEEEATLVTLALPEERQRIRELLGSFPEGLETKASKLIEALRTLWQAASTEKVVIFATYLGTVELLGRRIEAAFPGAGVVVLRGGDHGAKLAAERRFRATDGPRVLICTAAGREGINLQFARVLFNFDLPWNPMDLEQRIGRIHRYGQAHTAQVYNLVLADTIEGRIFLLLEDKLAEIAGALGKVDARGNVTEDLRVQILGQLGERISYDALYRAALSDPELRRTREELEAALANARESRAVVFDLFQDLDRFSIDDYRPFADVSAGIERLVAFFAADLADRGLALDRADDGTLNVLDPSRGRVERFTIDRARARTDEGLTLFGLDHPWLTAALARARGAPPEQLGVSVRADGDEGVVTIWRVEHSGADGAREVWLVPIAVDEARRRLPRLERTWADVLRRAPALSTRTADERRVLAVEVIEPMLERELVRRGVAHGVGSYTAELLAWIETVA